MVECVGTAGVSEQVKDFLSESMKVWKIDLICSDQSLGGVDIKRVIFQGDLISPFFLCFFSSH